MRDKIKDTLYLCYRKYKLVDIGIAIEGRTVMYKDLEKVTALAMSRAGSFPIVEPQLYEKIFNDILEEQIGSPVYIDEESIMKLSNELHEQADNIVNAVDAKEYEKISDYRDAIAALKQENEKLLKMAYTDELTGAYSRRWLFGKKLINGLFAENGYLVVVDMNGFKQLNDKHGHNVGDSILKIFVEAMQNKAIAKNIPCSVTRFGGDEFIVLIDEKNDLMDAEIVNCLSTLKDSLVNKILIKASGERISIDFSFGFTNYFTDDDFREILEIADHKMLASKKQQSELINSDTVSKVRDR